MPRGPQKQWRPAGTAECAVHVMRIATGELDETFEPTSRDPDPDASKRASVAAKARLALVEAAGPPETGDRSLPPATLERCGSPSPGTLTPALRRSCAILRFQARGLAAFTSNADGNET